MSISVEFGRIACGDPATSLGDGRGAELQSLGAQTGAVRRPIGSVSVARGRVGGGGFQPAGLGRATGPTGRVQQRVVRPLIFLALAGRGASIGTFSANSGVLNFAQG